MQHVYPVAPTYRRTADNQIIRVAEVAYGTVQSGDRAVRLLDINHVPDREAPECGPFRKRGSWAIVPVTSVGHFTLDSLTGVGDMVRVWLEPDNPTGVNVLSAADANRPFLILAQ